MLVVSRRQEAVNGTHAASMVERQRHNLTWHAPDASYHLFVCQSLVSYALRYKESAKQPLWTGTTVNGKPNYNVYSSIWRNNTSNVVVIHLYIN
jgi:hypothetical protein